MLSRGRVPRGERCLCRLGGRTFAGVTVSGSIKRGNLDRAGEVYHIWMLKLGDVFAIIAASPDNL